MEHDSGKLVFFWDYDTQWGGDRSRLAGGVRAWGYREFENTEKLLALHAKYAVPACFAVVGAASLPGKRPYHDQEQIQAIHKLGHEIASHTMYHEWLPGLSYPQLIATLKRSKDALEDCIGEKVVTFVPPYNQPFDYPSKGSISISERREAGRRHIHLSVLAEALAETGYLFSRVSYHPLRERFAILFHQNRYWPEYPEKIGKITCLRLNSPGGFAQDSLALLDLCARQGGYALIYGHPHSLSAPNSQGESFLIPFLEKVKNLVEAGRLQVKLPKQILAAEEQGAV